MAATDNELVERIKIEVSDAKTNIKSLTKDLQGMQKTFDKISSIKFNVNSIINQFKNLRKSLKLPKASVSFKGLTDNLRSMTDPFKFVEDRAKVLQSGINKYQKMLQKGMPLKKADKQELANLQAEARALSNNAYIKELAANKSLDLKTQEDKLKQSTKALKQAQDEQSESTKKSASSWQKLFGRIRNISIYRIIRSALREFTQGISEGIKELSLFDDATNKSMANIKASFGQLNNTLAVSLTSILQSLEPVITSIVDGITSLLNSFNRAIAKAQSKDYYLRAKKNADKYAESAKKAQKLSFDVFETLSGGDESNPEDDFERVYFSEAAKQAAGDTEGIVESAEEANEGLNGITETLVNIAEALGVGLYAGITKISSGMGGFVGKIISGVSELKNFKKASDETTEGIDKIHKSTESTTTAISNMTAGIAATAFAVTSIITNWDEMSTTAKTLTIVITVLTAVIAAAAFAIYAALQQWGKAFSVAGGVLAAGMSVAGGLATIQGFADGGFTTANFIATNENGRREWVGRNAGATAVVNDTQMSDIMYGAVRDGCYQGILQAMYDNGGGQSGNAGEVVLKVDANVLGRVVAESAGFRNEVNRRNVALNLR